jgi:hypothetical protein
MIASRSFACAVAALVVLGCLRPVLPAPFGARWGALIVVTALAAAGLKLVRVRRDPSRYETALVALLPLALLALYLQPQRVASDGIFYFAPLHSIVVDFDLDFENEYRILGAGPGYLRPTGTGRLPNQHSIGPALFWFPSFAAAHALGKLGLYRPTGFGYPYFTAIATTTVFAGFLGVIFVFRLVRAYYQAGLAFVSALLVWLATFHIWYMVVEPSMSHAFAMATVAGFLLLTHRGITGTRAFILAGTAGGLLALARWQNAVFLPIALVTSVAAHGRPKPREILAGGLAFLAVFSPQLLYWKALYGSFLLIPQGGGYLDWTRPRLEEVLFSSRHGLLSWAPVLWLALGGLPGFARRAPAFGLPLVAALFLTLYVNASVSDWWAGASFGSRRFDGALPLFALGLAAALARLVPLVARRPLLSASLMLMPFVSWNFLLMGVYFEGAIPPDGPASFRQAASDALELVYRRTGYPFSWPGAWKDYLLQRRPLPVYDLAGSRSLSHNVDIRMGDNDALFLGRGWSLPHRARDGTRREAAPAGAELFVSLVEPADYELELRLGAFEPAEVRFNGEILGVVEADSSGAARISIPEARVRSGVNELALGAPERTGLEVYRVVLKRAGE